MKCETHYLLNPAFISGDGGWGANQGIKVNKKKRSQNYKYKQEQKISNRLPLCDSDGDSKRTLKDRPHGDDGAVLSPRRLRTTLGICACACVLVCV